MKKWHINLAFATVLLLLLINLTYNGKDGLNHIPINFNNRKNVYFVFINGLGAKCDGSIYNNMDFPEIRKTLSGLGFNFYDPHFLMYSYNGGKVVNGRWVPEKYTPSDTGQFIQLSIYKLQYLVEQFSFAHPKARYILIGHSLGGRIALDFVSEIKPELRRKIDGVVTLNAPLLGSPVEIPTPIIKLLESVNSVWVSPAVKQLFWENNNKANELFKFRREAINKLQNKGVEVATFSTRQDKLVDAATACITDDFGTPLTAGTIIDIDGYSLKDIAGHMRILDNKKVKSYLVSLYINSILSD